MKIALAVAGLIVAAPVLLLVVALVVALIAAILVFAVLSLVTAILLLPFRLFLPRSEYGTGGHVVDASANVSEGTPGGGDDSEGTSGGGGRRNVRVILHSNIRTEA